MLTLFLRGHGFWAEFSLWICKKFDLGKQHCTMWKEHWHEVIFGNFVFTLILWEDIHILSRLVVSNEDHDV